MIVPITIPMNASTALRPTETKLHRIQRISRVIRAFCTFLLIVSSAGAAAATAATLIGRGATVRFFDRAIVVSELSFPARLLVAAVCLLTGAVFAKAIYHFRRLMSHYARREIFTHDAARQIRHFGYGCIGWGVMKIVWAFLPSMAAGHAPHTISVGAEPIVMGGAVIVLSWFTEMATLLREENDLTI